MIRGLIGSVISLIILVGAGYSAAVVYINTDGRRLAATYLQPWGQRGKITYGSVYKSFFKDELTIQGVTLVTPIGRTLRIRQIAIRDYDWLHPSRPRFADVAITGVEITAKGIGPPVSTALKNAGLDKLLAHARYRYRFDPDAARLTLESVRIDVENLGELRFEARLANVTSLEFGRGQAARKFLEGRLIDAAVTFKNQNLVQRIIKGYATARNLKEGEAREALLEEFRKQQKLQSNALTRDLFTALIKFFEDPGRIEVRAIPRRPMAMTSIAALYLLSPAELKRMLRLEIKAHPASGNGAK
jgi:hypothetical protein